MGLEKERQEEQKRKSESGRLERERKGVKVVHMQEDEVQMIKCRSDNWFLYLNMHLFECSQRGKHVFSMRFHRMKKTSERSEISVSFLQDSKVIKCKFFLYYIYEIY